MTPILKLQKRSTEFEARHSRKVVGIPSFRQAEEDRITDLPSCLKTKILSCLPTKDAVRTSVLSTNWEKSWTSITNLEFDLGDYGYDRNDVTWIRRFTNFVNRIFLLHDGSCLQRFRLYGCRSSDLPIHSWISSVLLYNVQEIDLSIPVPGHVYLPSSLFVSKNLVVLKLKVYGFVKIPSPVNLPRLRTLNVYGVRLSDDKSISSIVSGCPVLEELSLSRCIGCDVRKIDINSPVITSLSLEELPCLVEDAHTGDFMYQIILDTPALQVLIFRDQYAKGYAVKNLNNLVKAVISVGTANEWYDDGDSHRYEDFHQFLANRPEAITSFLNGISHIQKLLLSSESMEAFREFDPIIPTFGNLTYMELSMTYQIGWTLLPKLLKNTPRLQTLHLDWIIRITDSTSHFSFDGVPACFLSNLKIIRIGNYTWLDREMKLVEFFILNAKVLENLTIKYWPFSKNTEAYNKFLKRLQMVSRSSPACQVEVI